MRTIYRPINGSSITLLPFFIGEITMYNLLINYIDSEDREELSFGQHFNIKGSEVIKLLNTYKPNKFKGVERFIFDIQRIKEK